MSGCVCVFFCKQKTAYEMRISDWGSDVCSSDLNLARALEEIAEAGYWRIGLDGEAEASLAEALPSGPCALVLGAEGEGMRHNIVQHCDEIGRASCRERACQYV